MPLQTNNTWIAKVLSSSFILIFLFIFINYIPFQQVIDVCLQVPRRHQQSVSQHWLALLVHEELLKTPSELTTISVNWQSWTPCSTYSWVRPAWTPQTCVWSGGDFNFAGSHAWEVWGGSRWADLAVYVLTYLLRILVMWNFDFMVLWF